MCSEDRVGFAAGQPAFAEMLLREKSLAFPRARLESKRVKLGQLSEAAIYTSDLAAAERFYRDVLRLEKISAMENRGVAFRCGATVLLIFDPERTRIPDAGVPTHGAEGPGHVAFVIEHSELEGWKTRLKEHGVAIEAEVDWPGSGRSIYFRDPAGNVVELAPAALWG